jgi:nicotinate phosphoribosyltransferase
MGLIIKSLLDNDLYKFSMGAAVFQMYPRAWVKYKFIDRGKAEWPEGFVEKLRFQVGRMSELEFAHEDIAYLREMCPYLPPTYLEWLQHFRFKPWEVKIKDGKGLDIEIVGPWRSAIYWEVPLMALISELYFQGVIEQQLERGLDKKDIEKAETLRCLGVKFADFGTRRRFSLGNQERVISLIQPCALESLVGVSNVYLARKFHTRPMGTQAHEWFMFHAAKYGFKYANEISLEKWVEMYQGNLGIALSDTYTTGNFLKAFGPKYARLFDGVRHDSGDPLEFADKMIHHYQSLKIDPRSKTIVFSDGLDVEAVGWIERNCRDHEGNSRIKTSYGIGTNLTNDVGVVPLNMVIKMVEADPNGNGDWTPTVKLSDVDGKHTGDPKWVKICQETLGIK